MNAIKFNTKKEGETSSHLGINKALIVLRNAIMAGLFSILIYSLQAESYSQYFSFVTIGLMVSGAFLFIGGLLGFLFGIPRTLQIDRSINTSTESQTNILNKNNNYQPNTNLEQISDWLTKILVGVGLTKIGVIQIRLFQIAKKISTGIGNSDSSTVFALAIILFFTICGFLLGYLWTRLFLPGAFRQADIDSLETRVDEATIQVKKVNEKLIDLEKQTKLDALALSLAQRQLNPIIDIPPVTQEELNNAISNSSRFTKTQIFYQAQNVRTTNWRNDKAKMALTIQVFKALIESDTKNEFHQNHGELGFALKDLSIPEWAEAEIELTKAIEIRGNEKESGWPIYEFNRAFCRIKQDKEFLNKKKSNLEVKSKILNDLNIVENSNLPSNFKNDSVIQEWLLLNK